MSEQKHTAGPWKAPSAGIWTADGCCMVAALGGREVTASRREYARRNLGDTETCNRAEMDTLRADLALIAAAPDLLSALQAIFKECALIHRYGGDACNQKEADAAIAAGHAAIHKATGN